MEKKNLQRVVIANLKACPSEIRHGNNNVCSLDSIVHAFLKGE